MIRTASGSAFTVASIGFNRKDNSADGGSGFKDTADVELLRLSAPAGIAPFAFSYLDVGPVGACRVFNTPNGPPDPPFAGIVPLNAGAQITVQGPNGSKAIPFAAGSFQGTLSAAGNFFGPGTLTLNVPGGSDVPAFTASLTVPAMPVMTSPQPDTQNATTVTRANGLTVTWTGGAAGQYVMLDGIGATDNTFNTGASFQCLAPAQAGSFTIPANVLAAMPATNFGALFFHPLVAPVNVPAAKVDISTMNSQYEYLAPLNFR